MFAAAGVAGTGTGVWPRPAGPTLYKRDRKTSSFRCRSEREPTIRSSLTAVDDIGWGRLARATPIAKPKHLQVFLCHSRADKAAAKELYKKLKADGYDPWLDAVNLIPGQDWEMEIKRGGTGV